MFPMAPLDSGSRSSLGSIDVRSRALIAGLATALTAPDQFSLAYQPRIGLRSQECLSAEALLRWTHRTLGPALPTEGQGCRWTRCRPGWAGGRTRGGRRMTMQARIVELFAYLRSWRERKSNVLAPNCRWR